MLVLNMVYSISWEIKFILQTILYTYTLKKIKPYQMLLEQVVFLPYYLFIYLYTQALLASLFLILGKLSLLAQMITFTTFFLFQVLYWSSHVLICPYLETMFILPIFRFINKTKNPKNNPQNFSTSFSFY